MIGSQLDGPVHHLFRRQVADSALSIPLFDGAEAGNSLRFSIRNNVAVIQLLDEAGKAVHAVGIDTGLGGASEHFRALVGGIFRNIPRPQDAVEGPLTLRKLLSSLFSWSIVRNFSMFFYR